MSTVVEEAAAAVPRSDRRERIGWYFYAFADHAFYTTLLAVFLGPFLTSVAKNAADGQGNVHPLGITVSATSFYPYLISLSVFLSIFALPIVGALADRSAHRKRLLVGLAFSGAVITCGFAIIPRDGYLLGGCCGCGTARRWIRSRASRPTASGPAASASSGRRCAT